ncbi:MAG TPA: hypothetical protein DEP05_08140 [Betaproteobacteria bacterium]|nr:hypothetical protein [Betaproteobacteria bacterium]
MDENAYRNTFSAINQITCPFEKAVLSRRVDCEKLVRINIAEREAAGCSSLTAQEHCDGLLAHLRRNALFALHLTHAEAVLPHAKEMKVQCGGLLGLQAQLFPASADAARVDNVYILVKAALERFGGVENIPYQEIVKAVSAFELRRPHR